MFDSIIQDGLSVLNAAICTAVSLGLGLLIAFVYRFKSASSKNFLITLLLIPAIVQAVIMMVNGNIGTGVAVLGAFSLVRFRSVPGNSKDISFIFFAMAIGIATGIGQIWFALAFTVLISAIFIVVKLVYTVKGKDGGAEKDLKITVPEDLDFEKEIAEVLAQFTSRYETVRIKTTNMGSLFTVDYVIKLKSDVSVKTLIDSLRVKNSNLPITVVNHREECSEL